MGRRVSDLDEIDLIARRLRVLAARNYGLSEAGRYRGESRARRIMRSRQAVIYVLRHELHVEFRQIAKVLGLSTPTVEGNYERIQSRVEGGVLDELTAESLPGLRAMAGSQ